MFNKKSFCIRRVIFISSSLLILLSSSTVAQQGKEKATAVIVPSEIYLPTIVAQPDSPLKIETAVVGKMLDGTERTFFRARNVTNKPIKSFQIYVLASNGSGFTSSFPYKRAQGTLAPNEVAPPGLNDDAVQFIPLTPELIQSLRLSGKMRLIVFFIVLKVEFEDGTIFDADRLLNSLEEHLKLFGDKYEPNSFQSQPRPN
jgi:hypothetical protein